MCLNGLCGCGCKTPELEVVELVIPKHLHGTFDNKIWANESPYGIFDAKVWAKMFCDTIGFEDEEWAFGWFANAIMTGYDKGVADTEFKACGCIG